MPRKYREKITREKAIDILANNYASIIVSAHSSYLVLLCTKGIRGYENYFDGELQDQLDECFPESYSIK